MSLTNQFCRWPWRSTSIFRGLSHGHPPLFFFLLLLSPDFFPAYIKGAWSLFVCLASFCSRGPPLAIILRIIAVILDLVAFIVALTNFPYSAGCSTNVSPGCQVLKGAIGVDGVLWYDVCAVRTWLIVGFCSFAVCLRWEH